MAMRHCREWSLRKFAVAERSLGQDALQGGALGGGIEGIYRLRLPRHFALDLTLPVHTRSFILTQALRAHLLLFSPS